MKFHNYAKTPPKGWNSWDCYGASVTEEEVKGNAQYMAEHLKDYGWEYVVVDIQWYESLANSSKYRKFADLEMDDYSRLIPAINRFPSAKDETGFKQLGDYIHNLGLKFGIHIMRGVPRQAVHLNTPIKNSSATARDIAKPNSISPWNTDMYGIEVSAEGAREYYESLIELYSSWGVDFIKVDDIGDSKLYGAHLEEIELLRDIIDEADREIVLSLSPGPASLEHGSFLQRNANMWRLTDDYWDTWPQLYDMFERCEKWAPFVEEGTWPDCDMLPLGHIGIRSTDGGASDRMTRFTKEEQRTMMSLWSLFKSPLFFGGELRDNDDWTLSLLQNKALLEMHEEGKNPKQVYRKDDIVIWHSMNEEAENYIGVFNLNDYAVNVQLSLEDYLNNRPSNGLNIWEQEEIAITNTLSLDISPHDVKLFKFYDS